LTDDYFEKLEAALAARDASPPEPVRDRSTPAAPLDTRLTTGDGEVRLSDAMVEELTRRVVERLAPNLVRDVVVEVVRDVAERLVRQEIERIRNG
jgi:hypothetical protein